MVRKIDEVIARKSLIEEVLGEIKRRTNISKKTKGKSRKKKKGKKGKGTGARKRGRRKIVNTTQTKQPPIKLTDKEAKALLQVNITGKERRRKKPKSFAQRRADEISKTGVADPSVLKQQQRITSEALGYTTQTKDPLTLRGKVGRYNQAGGVGGHYNVGARYDTGEQNLGIRTGLQSQATRGFVNPDVEEFERNDVARTDRRPNISGARKRGSRRFPDTSGRRGGGGDDDDDDDDDDDFQDPSAFPAYKYRPITKETRFKTKQERRAEAKAKLGMDPSVRPRASWDTGWRESIFGRKEGIHGETQRREPAEAPSAKLKPYAERVLNLPQARSFFAPKETARTPAPEPAPEPAPKGVITPLRPVSPEERFSTPERQLIPLTDEEDFETDTESGEDVPVRPVLRPSFKGTLVPKPRKAESSPKAGFGSIQPYRSIPIQPTDFTPDRLEIQDREPQPLLMPSPQRPLLKPPAPKSKSPIFIDTDDEFEDVDETLAEAERKRAKEIEQRKEDVKEAQEKGVSFAGKKKPIKTKSAPAEPQPPIQSTGRGRGRPKGSKNKPKTQPEPEPEPAGDKQELVAENRRLTKVLKNVLGKGKFNANQLDEVRSEEELDINIATVYEDADMETIANLQELYRIRKLLGYVKKR